ncbi:class I SAM-dependent methyltransferase [Bacillus sp. WLY-B-L8]|uniref:class I SAM-dependent methyltransferase n=1 Tax=Bacillus multifaciens TaxID=3068506 RepID=UPI002741F06A|nr:class I SAM-dependent methyltransferase [Bacillus sp. WLY-B-L8]MDP7977843.1 methyltransferase domain-containing protein [Bacillus sp. WLY-B-L8]
MKAYYSNRAKNYEEVYFREEPIRQAELLQIEDLLKEKFIGRNVLEVACGTGYWTQYVAETAKYITAIDYSEEVLAIAKEKKLLPSKVSFVQGNAYRLNQLAKTFNGAYANFWFSHIPKENIFSFLEQFHEVLESGSIVCMVDNMYNEGIGGTLISKPNDENTYKIRLLASGQQYEIIKNYYSKEELTTIFEPFAVDLEIHMNTCFWIVTYKVK